MKQIGVTMRADTAVNYDETRDALDQEWIPFLLACNLFPILIPNNPLLLEHYLDHFTFDGILLTGGNSPIEYGGDSSARDQLDKRLIDWASDQAKPLIGVCRGMQSIQIAYDHELQPVDNHVQKHQTIKINGRPETVNSYHTLGTRECSHPLITWAISDDGVVKAVKHINKPIVGIMWHPERNAPFDQRDIDFFKRVY